MLRNRETPNLNAPWARRLAGGVVLACAAAVALVGWLVFGRDAGADHGRGGASDYGQAGTSDPRIPAFVLSWLDHHFAVVFGGDYLDQGKGRRLAIPGRFSPRLSYRMSLGPEDTLRVLHCRLSDFVQRRPIAAERRCSRPAPQPGGQTPRAAGPSAASGTGGRPSSRCGAPGAAAVHRRTCRARRARRS